MKIALIVPGGVDRSGSHRVIPCLLWFIERLVRAGDEVHVFALQQEPRPGRWQLLGAEVHNAGARPRRLRALGQLLAEQRRGGFDVVHGFWAGGSGLVAAIFRRLTGVPAVLTLPGGDLAALRDIGYGAWLTRRGRILVRAALAGVDQVVVPSEAMGARAALLGIETVRIRYGVALDRWPVREPLRRNLRKPLRLVHVANLNRVKDQDTLLRALAMARDRGLDFRLDVVGLDTLGGEVQRRCTELRLDDRVVFHGFLPHAGLRRWIEQADLLLVSSRHEGVPIVALEAAVAGVPTVGTAVGQVADWAPHAAVAVPVRDSAALADAIMRLATDEEARLALARAAQASAIADNVDVMTALTRRLYESLRADRGKFDRS